MHICTYTQTTYIQDVHTHARTQTHTNKHTHKTCTFKTHNTDYIHSYVTGF